MITERDSLAKQRGNFQELRNMWSLKAQAQPLYPTLEQKQSPKQTKVLSIPIIKKNPPSPSSSPSYDIESKAANQFVRSVETVEKMPIIEEYILPPPPKPLFQYQAQSVATIKQALNKMTIPQRHSLSKKEILHTGIHRWHITKHVFRSGLIFNRKRRASDSILPLLFKTHQANRNRPRADSVDSIFSQNPFENLIDYITHNKLDENDPSTTMPRKTHRSVSDVSHCIRRNKLDDSIFQYELILRHLKNYEQFMSTYSSQSNPGQSPDMDQSMALNEIETKFLAKTNIPNRQTQSLSRNVGRTFSEFIMNDLFPSTPSMKEQRCSISQASTQTDSVESTQESKESTEINPSIPVQSERSNSTINEEANIVLNEFDQILDSNQQEPSITPNSVVNTIIISPVVETLPVQKPLMQRLFEGKKTAYSPADLDMETVRLPEEMLPEYEIAKRKCFFDTEQHYYVTKMIKISRRGYTEHVRMLCITTERIYNFTKRKPYPKEVIFFNNILGITCTPYKDGFMCIHTKEANEDRGDWLVVVERPCEFITQLFMILKRDHNDDHFLKFETKFTHCRRSIGEGSSDGCRIEARLADTFSIKKADFDFFIISILQLFIEKNKKQSFLSHNNPP